MLRKLKKSLVTLLAVSTLLGLAGFSYAAMTNYHVTLPRFQADVTVLQDHKSTNLDYVLNRVDNVGAGYWRAENIAK